jgi:hypothetical protein
MSLEKQISKLKDILDDKKWEINLQKIKETIDKFFENHNIFEDVRYYCTAPGCGCVEIGNLLDMICNRDIKVIKFFFSYCFEKMYMVKDRDQKNILDTMYRKWKWEHNTDSDKELYEFLLFNILTKDTILNSIYNYKAYFDIPKLSVAHLMFNSEMNGKKYLSRIFKYLDSINFNYNNPNTYSLMTRAISVNSEYGITQLYLRKVDINRSDVHNNIELDMMNNICYIRYNLSYLFHHSSDILLTKISTYFGDRYTLDNIQPILLKKQPSLTSLDDYIDSDCETELPPQNRANMERDIKYKFSLLIHYNDDLIRLFFLNDQKLSNIELNQQLFELYMKILKKEYPYSGYDIDDINYYISDFREDNLRSEKYYENKYNLLKLLISYGFIPSDTLIQLYLNGCNLIRICYPNIHQKMLDLFKVPN